MPLFEKKDDQAGSGIDKADPKSLKEKITDTIKAVIPGEAKPVDTGNVTAQKIPS